MQARLASLSYWCVSICVVGAILDTDVDFSFGNYGRVRIHDKELCSDDSGPDHVTSEALCRVKGLKVGVTGRERLQNQSVGTLDITCSAPSVQHCNVSGHPSPCSQVLYLYCDGTYTVSHSTEQHPMPSHGVSHFTKTTHLTTPRKIVSYDVHFDFTQAGRVRVQGRQICLDTFTTTAGKALCSSKGFIYASHESALVYLTNPYVDMVCTEANLTTCSLRRRQNLCRQVVYIHCSTHTTLKPPTSTLVPDTTILTRPANALKIAVRDIFFAFPRGGHVKVRGVEICSDTFTQTAGEILCRAKGWHYSSFSRSFSYERYRTASFLCVSSSLSSCFTRPDICIDIVVIHCDGPALPKPSVACTDHPCLNGGVCHQDTPYDDYSCTCMDDYAGKQCETFTGLMLENITTADCQNNAWDITINLSGLLTKYPDFNISDLYIGENNKNCTGTITGKNVVFHKNVDVCQTTKENTTSGVFYQTALVYAVHDPNYHFIVREKRFRLNITCSVSFPNGPIPTDQTSLSSKNALVFLEYFSDSSFIQNKTLDQFQVGEKVYVRAFSNVTDGNARLLLSDCYTLPSKTLDPQLMYFLIRNGCSTDPNAGIISERLHESVFVFQYFEYAMTNGLATLQCNATLCLPSDSTDCQTACNDSAENLEDEYIIEGSKEQNENNLGVPNGDEHITDYWKANQILLISIFLVGFVFFVVVFILIVKLRKARKPNLF